MVRRPVRRACHRARARGRAPPPRASGTRAAAGSGPRTARAGCSRAPPRARASLAPSPVQPRRSRSQRTARPCSAARRRPRASGSRSPAPSARPDPAAPASPDASPAAASPASLVAQRTERRIAPDRAGAASRRGDRAWSPPTRARASPPSPVQRPALLTRPAPNQCSAEALRPRLLVRAQAMCCLCCRGQSPTTIQSSVSGQSPF
eukprot:6184907-Pleurochrysis_carterae.AAC.2